MLHSFKKNTPNQKARGVFICVESEGFEPSSKHGANYAFYMLSNSFIVEKGKVNRLPIPASVGAVFRSFITPLNKLVR